MPDTRLHVTAVLILVAACTPAAQQTASQADIDAIRDIITQETVAATTGNTDAFMQFLASDATIAPPGQPAVSGAEDIRAWIDAFMSGYAIQELEYTDEQIIVGPEWAVHWYGFRWVIAPKGGGDAVTEQGHGVHIFRQGPDGTWRMVNDIWNTVGPPAGSS